jgi:hypothetical protein
MLLHMRISPRLGFIPTLALVFSSTSLARAQASNSSGAAESAAPLKWVAPPNCPTEAWVNAEIIKLGATERTATPRELRARAVVEQLEPGRFHVTLTTEEENREGTRELDGRTCDEVAKMTVLVMAMMFRTPDQPLDESAAAKPATPVSTLDTTTGLDADSMSFPRKPQQTRAAPNWSALLGGVAAGHAGMLPTAWFAIGGALGIRFQRTRLQLAALY